MNQALLGVLSSICTWAQVKVSDSYSRRDRYMGSTNQRQARPADPVFGFVIASWLRIAYDQQSILHAHNAGDQSLRRDFEPRSRVRGQIMRAVYSTTQGMTRLTSTRCRLCRSSLCLARSTGTLQSRSEYSRVASWRTFSNPPHLLCGGPPPRPATPARNPP